jgi:hypothetical protein
MNYLVLGYPFHYVAARNIRTIRSDRILDLCFRGLWDLGESPSPKSDRKASDGDFASRSSTAVSKIGEDEFGARRTSQRSRVRCRGGMETILFRRNLLGSSRPL